MPPPSAPPTSMPRSCRSGTLPLSTTNLTAAPCLPPPTDTAPTSESGAASLLPPSLAASARRARARPRTSRAQRPSPSQQCACAVSQLRQHLVEATPGRRPAILVVGHDPFIGWVAYELTGKRIPINRSELICIKLLINTTRRHPGTFIWSLTPTEGAEFPTAKIRDKIKSKLDLAKVLGRPHPALIVASARPRPSTRLKRPIPHFAHACAPGWLVLASPTISVLPGQSCSASTSALSSLLINCSCRRVSGARRANPGTSSFGAGSGRPWSKRPPSSSVAVLYQNMQTPGPGSFSPRRLPLSSALPASPRPR